MVAHVAGKDFLRVAEPLSLHDLARSVQTGGAVVVALHGNRYESLRPGGIVWRRRTYNTAAFDFPYAYIAVFGDEGGGKEQATKKKKKRGEGEWEREQGWRAAAARVGQCIELKRSGRIEELDPQERSDLEEAAEQFAGYVLAARKKEKGKRLLQVLIGVPTVRFLANIPVRDVAMLLSNILPHPGVWGYERADQLLGEGATIQKQEVLEALSSEPFRTRFNAYLDAQVRAFAGPQKRLPPWLRFSDIFPADFFFVFSFAPINTEYVQLWGRLYLSETANLGDGKYDILRDPLNHMEIVAEISL